MKQSLIMAIVMSAFAPISEAYAKVLSPQLPKSIEDMPATKLFKIPGLLNLVGEDTPIYLGSNFTWGEATRQGTRIPCDTIYGGKTYKAETITSNIILLARELDKIREQFGNKPILINSWYRPPSVNGRTKGAGEMSLHLLGLAADVVIVERGSHHVYRMLDRQGWPGGLGRYINRTHIDIRHKIGMPAARWNG